MAAPAPAFLLAAAPPAPAPSLAAAAPPARALPAPAAASDCAGAAAAHRAHLVAQTPLFDSENSFAVFTTWSRLAASGAAPQPLLVVDVGANTGQSARVFLGAFPRARVASFEPSSHNFQQLRRAWGEAPADEASRWALHELAVAAAPGVANFSAPTRGANPQSFSLGENAAVGLAHTQRVNVTSVDALLGDGGALAGAAFVDLLKVDVEGWEGDVFFGAARALAAAPPRVGAVFFECCLCCPLGGAAGFAARDSRAGPRAAPLAQVIAQFSARGFECFYAGAADLVRVAHGEGVDIAGYGPNVLCVHRELPASRALVAAHKGALQPCLW